MSISAVFVAGAMYAVARHRPAPWSLLASGSALLAILMPEWVRADWRWGDLLTVSGLVLVVWSLGESRQRIERHAARTRLMADQLKAEKQISEERAVVAERARIARDVHDLVAHHVGAIALQTRAAMETVQDDLLPLRQSLDSISVTADTALTEMHRLLGLLATGDELAAKPSLAHLEPLARTAEAAGCRVAFTVTDRLDHVSMSVQTCAYRIIQEALTNAAKHAPGTDISVTLDADPRFFTVEISNGPAAGLRTPIGPGGFGLIGMRERVAAFAGRLTVRERPDGGWFVQAVLPVTGEQHR
ncbi:sensor histidine kinase [Nonomuraea sp. JJY05]|uniref:sensor histidine kinase n=1 Tax=Nonomuraea sp. JJY05 TaxID=3350255 RepID=UPI00373F112B